MIVADLPDQGDIEMLTDFAPSLDGVVYNAGKGNTLPLNFIKREDIDKILKINTFSAMLFNKALLRRKNKERCFLSFHILNCSSNDGSWERFIFCC